MVQNIRLKKIFKKIVNPLGVHGNMRGCILEVNSKGLGW